MVRTVLRLAARATATAFTTSSSPPLPSPPQTVQPARMGVAPCPACEGEAGGTLVLDPVSAPAWRLDCSRCSFLICERCTLLGGNPEHMAGLLAGLHVGLLVQCPPHRVYVAASTPESAQHCWMPACADLPKNLHSAKLAPDSCEVRRHSPAGMHTSNACTACTAHTRHGQACASSQVLIQLAKLHQAGGHAAAGSLVLPNPAGVRLHAAGPGLEEGAVAAGGRGHAAHRWDCLWLLNQSSAWAVVPCGCLCSSSSPSNRRTQHSFQAGRRREGIHMASHEPDWPTHPPIHPHPFCPQAASCATRCSPSSVRSSTARRLCGAAGGGAAAAGGAGQR